MSISVRPATRADTQAILALSRQTLTAHRERFPDHFASPNVPAEEFLAEFFSRRRPGVVLVAEENGEVIGWTAYAQFDVPFDKKRSDVLGLIMDITVASHAQNRGVGTALIDTLVSRAKEAGVTLLQADLWMGGPSAGILERAGITPVKTVHDRRLGPQRKAPPGGQSLMQWLAMTIIALVVLLVGVVIGLVI